MRGQVPGRIAGEVVELLGVGSDTHVLVDDTSGRVAIFCPAGTSPWRPSCGGRFEFEVTLVGGAAEALATDVRPVG